MDSAGIGDVLRSGSPESLQHYLFLLGEHDPGLVRHVFAVATYSRELAQRTGLSRIHTDIIWLAGLLHDVGKLLVPRIILQKRGPLTLGERRTIQTHAEAGWRILAPLSWAAEVAPLVRSHHEWQDGSGYPDGLVGDQIPPGARILTVADALDAMTSDRVYGPAASFIAAKQEISAMSGPQFDRCVVKAMLSVSEHEWIVMRQCVAAAGVAPRYPAAG